MIAVLDAIAGVSLLMVGLFGWRRFRTSAVFAMASAVAWFAVAAVPLLVLPYRPLLLHGTFIELWMTWGSRVTAGR